MTDSVYVVLPLFKLTYPPKLGLRGPENSHNELSSGTTFFKTDKATKDLVQWTKTRLNCAHKILVKKKVVSIFSQRSHRIVTLIRKFFAEADKTYINTHNYSTE